MVYKQPFPTPASASPPPLQKMSSLSWGSKAMRTTVCFCCLLSGKRMLCTELHGELWRSHRDQEHWSSTSRVNRIHLRFEERCTHARLFPSQSCPSLGEIKLRWELLAGCFKNFQVQNLIPEIWSLRRETKPSVETALIKTQVSFTSLSVTLGNLLSLQSSVSSFVK